MNVKSKLPQVPIAIVHKESERWFKIIQKAEKAALEASQTQASKKLSVFPADVTRDLDMLAKVLGDDGNSKPTHG